MKYYPQTSYINLRVPPGELTQDTVDGLVEDFLERHAEEFGYSVGLELTSVEFVNARLTALGPAPVGELSPDRRSGEAADAIAGTREVHFAEASGWVEATIYERAHLFPEATFDGPAIVQEVDSTTVVPPGARVRVDGYGNLVIDVREVARV
jgi:N-methylhydantoinase A